MFFAGIFLVCGLISGAAQAIRREGLFNWLRGCDCAWLDIDLDLPRNWMSVLIAQAIFTALYVGWAHVPAAPISFHIPEMVESVLWWSCVPGGLLAGVVVVVGGWGWIRNVATFIRVFRVAVAAYSVATGSVFEKLRLANGVFEELLNPQLAELRKILRNVRAEGGGSR